MEISGKKAVVVGGASGMARAAAELLHDKGASVAILDLPTSAGADVAKSLEGSFHAVDVTDEESVERALADAAEVLGGIHIAVNTAGGGGAARTLGKDGPHPLAEFRRVVELNLIATFNLNRLQALHMSRNEPEDGERGVIIDTASIAAFEGQIGQVAYTAAKAGIAGMMLTMARDLGSLGIRSVAIAPSLFSTGITKGIPDEFAAALTKDAAFPKRMGRPEEYGRLVVAIVETPMLNGSTIRLDAGQRFAPKQIDRFARSTGPTNVIDYDLIRYEMVADHVVRVVLNRPDVANALNVALFQELDDAVGRIERDDDVRVWMLTGAPRHDGRQWFSAGADLNMSAFPLDSARGLVNPAAVVDRIDDLLKPSIAVIGGFCTTGALEFAMACDVRIAGDNARLSDWHLKATGLGIGQWGAAVRLSRLVGVDKAKELLLTGVEISGVEAARIGLVNRAAPNGDLDVVALEMATAIAGMAPTGVRMTLGFLGLQESLSKHEAQRWGQLTPTFMGVRLRPFRDAVERFDRGDRD